MITLTNYCQLPRLISAPNYRTRGSGQRSWTQDWRSQTEGESEGMTGRSLLQTRQRKVFPATGGGAARATPSFIQAAFTSHTGSLLLSSPKKVTSPFVPFVPSPPSPFAIKKAKLLLRRSIAIRVSLFHPEAGLAAVH